MTDTAIHTAGYAGDNPHEIADPGRRDFTHIMAGGVAVAGASTIVRPLIDQLNPSADALTLASIEPDLAKVALGSRIRKGPPPGRSIFSPTPSCPTPK
ncbi:MAG: ubiquinol-cytochrome c reductase iron-sulfur subunit N-terminal domain-containing protein [Caulobacteraceae bacterium]